MSIYEQAEKAVAEGDIEGVRHWLASGGHIDDIIGYPEGRTALHVAAVSGNPEMVRFLLGYKPKLSACDEEIGTPLQVAQSALDRCADASQRASLERVATILEEAEQTKLGQAAFNPKWASKVQDERTGPPLPKSRWGRW